MERNGVIPLIRRLSEFIVAAALWSFACVVSADEFPVGPLYDRYPLTLGQGGRTEILGPLFYAEHRDTQRQWAIPPLTLSYTKDEAVNSEEYDFLYPLLTYNRYGAEYRWQFFQFIGFGGGKNPDESDSHRISLFPFYFQQRSSDPAKNYTAFFPFYGEIRNRFFRDDIKFVAFPIYGWTRKKDVVTRNMPYPFFHLRTGNSLSGWQIWPFTGHEHKDITWNTNGFGEVSINGGHDTRFILWPFYTRSTNDIGTTNVVEQHALIPFYSKYHSALRDSVTYSWPLGYTHTIDREKKYEERDAPWPLVEFAHGEGKHTWRVWPFYSHATNSIIEGDPGGTQTMASMEGKWIIWLAYKFNRITAPPLDRRRTRLFFFLYSVLTDTNLDTGHFQRRTDFFPFFTHHREFDGSERLQVMSIIEPIFPSNRKIERDYAPLYSFWRSERNAKTGNTYQSLLWNLYRRETTPETKKISLLFGLFQYQSNPSGARWRLCYVPIGGGKPPAPAESSRR